MTDAEIKELDDKRRQREEEMVALLLILFGFSVEQSIAGAGGGAASPAARARVTAESSASPADTSLSHVEHLLKTEGVKIIAESMAESHLDAYQIYEPSLAKAPDLEALAKQYASQAAEMAKAMVKAIERAGGDTLADSLLLAKYSLSDSKNIAVGAERQIVIASNVGVIDGAFNRQSGPKLSGFRHRSVLDDATTKICEGRDGYQLPARSAYWVSNWPGLHGGCRSVIEPIFGGFAVSSPRHLEPPDVGFGRMPAYMRQMIRRMAA